MRAGASWIVAVAAALLAGCMPHPAPAPPAVAARTITIAPPTNLTGDQLVVSGGSMLETWVLRSDQVTVPELLASEAEASLRARGYQATARPEQPGADPAGAGLRLTIEIRRWEPDSWSQPQFVLIGVSATLTDGAREVWSVRPPIRRVATPNVAVLGSAYEIAARHAVDELLGSWPARAG
jgi:hypothetical protein